ncbi:amidohydrolase [Novosphingobium sp. TH158]|uniref:amidohydrolase n=1 Tax=Novosphingobium sp. TH158 TaxID=2067455 RepID=UPI000C7A076F|nr:amidohydrolase [Novosphingobium sp. TH158]PLK25503.1 metal-dependent hydrolase [Novosphingobium sp. TH158]
MKRAAIALAALLFAGPALADTLLDNVDGLTLDEKGQVQRLTGIVFSADGRIVQVLKRGDKRPARTDYYIDGKGRVLMPGLIDAHVHVMDIGIAAMTLDLSGTKSLAEAQAAIARFAAQHPERKWIIGRGWNQEQWKLGRFPTAAELDSVVKDRPVWLGRVDGHAGWANSAALAAAGVTAATKDPAGGRIERGAAGQPSGVLVDNAMALVDRQVPKPRPAERDLALDKAQDLLASKGVTAVADMGTTIEDWQALRRAGDSGRLRIRVMSYAAGIDAMALIGGSAPGPWLYDDRLRLNGVKLYMDGALGSRGAALKAPYADAPGNRGLSLLSPAQVRNLMSRAAMDGFQVAVHAIGDDANAQVLDAVSELNETYKGDRRWRIEHAQVVDPADLARFGKLGVIASMQPVHQTSDRLMAEARLGPSRLSGAYSWKSIAASGGVLALGSDAPVESPEPFAGLAAAISRQGPDGQPFGGWQPQERLSREAALAGFTTGGAYAGLAETRFGRLAPGMRADFLLVDRDPLLSSPSELAQTRVLETWVGGRKVWSAPAPGGSEGR